MWSETSLPHNSIIIINKHRFVLNVVCYHYRRCHKHLSSIIQFHPEPHHHILFSGKNVVARGVDRGDCSLAAGYQGYFSSSTYRSDIIIKYGMYATFVVENLKIIWNWPQQDVCLLWESWWNRSFGLAPLGVFSHTGYHHHHRFITS